MKRSKELLASISAGIVLAVGVTACGNTKSVHAERNQPKPSRIEADYPYRAKIDRVAEQIIKLSKSSPLNVESKPPYTKAFSMNTREGGEILYAATSLVPIHSAKGTVTVEIGQDGPNEANFDLIFDLTGSQAWDMSCESNPFTKQDKILQETNQSSIELNHKSIDTSAIDADAMLRDEIVNANSIVRTAAATMVAENTMPALGNICNINLG